MKTLVPPTSKRRPSTELTRIPAAWRSDVASVEEAFIQLNARHNEVDAMRIWMFVIQQQLATKKTPGSGMTAALARGVVVREGLKLEEGGSVSAEEARSLLGGMSKEAVIKRYRTGRLLGWREVKQNAIRFPIWQFADGKVLPGLEEVLSILRASSGADDWAKILFFLTRRSSLANQRPLDCLRNGDLESVKQAAAAYAE